MTYFYYILNILIIGLMAYLVWQRESEVSIKKYFWPALILKLTAGILLGIFYQKYFGGGDAQLFQNQSDYVTEFARVSPMSYIRLLLTRNFESETLRTSMIYVWYSNSYFMVMLLSFLNFLTGGHYYLNSLYFSFFSFWGLWQLVKVINHLQSELGLPAIIAFLFFPSVVFWASGISKEAVYLGSLGWFIASVLRIAYRLPNRIGGTILSAILSGYLLWKIRFYFAALVFALLFSYCLLLFLAQKFKVLKSAKYQFLVYGIIFLVGGVVISSWHEALDINYFLAQLLQSNSGLAIKSAGKPMLAYPSLAPNLFSIAQNSPKAFFNTILRPTIIEGNSAFYFLAGIENMGILLLLVLTGWRIFRESSIKISLGTVVILLYVYITAALIGLSTPNIGSLNRYRTAFLPFFIFLLLSFTFPNIIKWLKQQPICTVVYNKITLFKK